MLNLTSIPRVLVLLAFLAGAASPAAAQLLAAKDNPIVYGHHHVNATSIDEHKTFWADTLGGTAATFGPQKAEMQAWYAKVFGATPRPARPGAAFVSANLPGVALNFSPSPGPVAGTAGRAFDHIGFEVQNLEEFCKRLEAQGIALNVGYRRVDAWNLAVAFITDPWGTSIELNEGLDDVP